MPAGIVLLVAVLAASSPNIVRGIVRGPDGQPVTKADVWLFDRQSYMLPDGLPAAHVITEEDGRFALTLPANAPFGRSSVFDVFAHKPGAGMAVADVDARLPSAPTLTLKLQGFAPVTLCVVDPGGEPVQNANVKALNFSDVSLRGNFWLPTAATPEPFAHRTDARGEVTFEFCDPLLSFSLIVDVPGYGVQMLGRLNDGSNPPLRLMHAGKLCGRLVADDPKLTAGALVWMMSVPTKPHDAVGVANVRTNAEGRFEVPAIAAGDVRVLYVEHAPGSPIFLEKEVKGTLQVGERLDLEVPMVRGVRVHGTVVEERTSVPLAAATVHVALNRSMSGAGARPVLTDKEGRYEAYVPPGAGQCSVQVGPLSGPWLPAHSDRLEGSIPAEGNELAMPDFIVRRGIMLTGTVVDAELRPVPLARVQAGAVDVAKGHYHCVLAETDSKGKFSMGPIDPDMVLALMAADDTGASPRILPIESWQAKGSIVLPIEAAAMAELSGRIVNSDGEPIADALIQAGSDMGNEKWEHAATRALMPIPLFTARTDKQGKYVLPNRVPILGRYYIQVICSGYVVKRLPLDGSDLSPGEQTLEDLVLAREKQK